MTPPDRLVILRGRWGIVKPSDARPVGFSPIADAFQMELMARRARPGIRKAVARLFKTGIMLAGLVASGLPGSPSFAQPPGASASSDERRRLQRCERRRSDPLARIFVGLLVSRDGLDAYDAIERRFLDACERERAAIARRRALQMAQQGQANEIVSWTSPTRSDVSGSVAASAITAEARGRECLVITNIVVVGGQETRVPRRMCRTPPSARFVEVRG